MKLRRVSVALLGATALAIASTALAGEGHDHGKDHDRKAAAESHFDTAAPATVKEAWALITGKVSEAEAALAAKNLHAAHEASEHMEAAVHTLQEKSDMVAVDAKTKVASALKQLDKAVDEIHHSTEEEDAEAASATLAKIKGLMPLVEKLYPSGALK